MGERPGWELLGNSARAWGALAYQETSGSSESESSESVSGSERVECRAVERGFQNQVRYCLVVLGALLLLTLRSPALRLTD